MLPLTPLIKRDAFERYLLIYNYVNNMSALWGGYLFTILFVSVLSTILTYYLLIISNGTAIGEIWGYILALVVEFVLFVYPVWCLQYANSNVDQILLNFRLASPEDYMLLGNRDDWKSFTKETPLYWTIVGVPITRKTLLAYLSAALPTLPLVLAVMFKISNDLPYTS